MRSRHRRAPQCPSTTRDDRGQRAGLDDGAHARTERGARDARQRRHADDGARGADRRRDRHPVLRRVHRRVDGPARHDVRRRAQVHLQRPRELRAGGARDDRAVQEAAAVSDYKNIISFDQNDTLRPGRLRRPRPGVQGCHRRFPAAPTRRTRSPASATRATTTRACRRRPLAPRAYLADLLDEHEPARSRRRHDDRHLRRRRRLHRARCALAVRERQPADAADEGDAPQALFSNVSFVGPNALVGAAHRGGHRANADGPCRTPTVSSSRRSCRTTRATTSDVVTDVQAR